MRARHLLIKCLTPVIWRFSEQRKLTALQEFSDTELDSGWQGLYALERISDPASKAELFVHAMEEFYHADMFARLQNSYANAPLNRTAFARETILQDAATNEAVLDFLAQIYVGESEINQDFVVYARTNVDSPIRDLFERIKKDEEGHEEVSWELLLKYAEGRIWNLRWVVLKKRFMHAYKRYANFMQVIGNVVLSAQLSVIYFVAGSFFVTVLRNRLTLDRKAQLEILRQQLSPIGAEKKA